MPVKAVQQFMLGTVMNREAQAADTMRKMKDAGYNGIELCGFMIHPSSMMVRLMTRQAGLAAAGQRQRPQGSFHPPGSGQCGAGPWGRGAGGRTLWHG